MKPKAKTLAERYGFTDPDLKTSKHDDIVLWLMNKENMYDVIAEIYGVFNLVERCRHRRSSWRLVKIGEMEQCQCPRDDEGHIVGNEITTWRRWDACPFEDEITREIACLKRKIQDAQPEKVKKYYTEQMGLLTEHPITSYKDYIVGFIDFLVNMNTPRFVFKEQKFIDIEQFGEHHNIYLEVKTKIDNFGETMRQLNMYRKFIQGPIILVVPSLSRELKIAFESQGINVFTTQTDVREVFK